MKTYTETEVLALRDAAVADAARHATAAERARCLAAASRVGAFAACDEMLRDAPDAGETPPQAFGRGVAEGRRRERDECARVCDAEARRLAAMVAHGNHVAGFAAEKVRAVARAIRARAPQEPPQRPEAPRDGATAAPDAPPPAGGLPGAAAGVCGDLLALASQAEAEAARYVADARGADRADAEASAERLRVRARAYRHAAEMLRGVAA